MDNLWTSYLKYTLPFWKVSPLYTIENSARRTLLRVDGVPLEPSCYCAPRPAMPGNAMHNGKAWKIPHCGTSVCQLWRCDWRLNAGLVHPLSCRMHTWQHGNTLQYIWCAFGQGTAGHNHGWKGNGKGQGATVGLLGCCWVHRLFVYLFTGMWNPETWRLSTSTCGWMAVISILEGWTQQGWQQGWPKGWSKGWEGWSWWRQVSPLYLPCLRAKILSGQINRPGAITELKGTWITGMIGFYAKQTFKNITVWHWKCSTV